MRYIYIYIYIYIPLLRGIWVRLIISPCSLSISCYCTIMVSYYCRVGLIRVFYIRGASEAIRIGSLTGVQPGFQNGFENGLCYMAALMLLRIKLLQQIFQ